jgi:DNA polymerase-3 subunit gamma/tau
MAQALYRKYRSRSLDEVVGQQNIIDALKRALDTNKISHAYLFTGPRGVGKTTVARILAHKVNNIDYTTDNMPIDIIEIDAASNRRIDEIRDLREKVKIAPVQSKYKVYIIDEVHMLTNEAFNALLKTLEEPPEHVIFILATTDSHKIPDTILSRTQRYNFKLAKQDEVINLLKKISSDENISIEDGALEVIAKQSGGSLRDALSLLDQIRHSSSEQISESEALEVLGLASQEQIDSLVSKLESYDLPTCIEILTDLESRNISPSQIADILSDIYRTRLVTGNSLSNKEKSITELLNNLLMVEQSPRPELSLEIAIINYLINSKSGTTGSQHIDKHQKLSSLDNQPSLTISKPAPKKLSQKPLEPTNIQNNIPQNNNGTALTEVIWNSMLEDLRSTHNTLYSVLRMSKLNTDNISDNIINLEFNFPFHQKRMSDSKNQQVVLEKLSAKGCNGYEIVCMVNNSKTTEEKTPKVFALATAEPEMAYNDKNSSLNNIKDIFGSVEVLE